MGEEKGEEGGEEWLEEEKRGGKSSKEDNEGKLLDPKISLASDNEMFCLAAISLMRFWRWSFGHS